MKNKKKKNKKNKNMDVNIMNENAKFLHLAAINMSHADFVMMKSTLDPKVPAVLSKD